MRITSSRRRAENEQGSVVLIALLLSGMIVALGLSLVGMASTERAVAANQQAALQALYGAEALAQYAANDLGARATWEGVLSGLERSSFAAGSLRPVTTWNEPLDLLVMTTELQQHTNPLGMWGANTPVWQLFAWGTYAALVGRGDSAPLYLIAWVADDSADGDGNPSADGNGVVTLRVQAIGQGGLRRIVQAVLKRTESDTSVIDETAAGLSAAELVAASAVARNLPASSGGAASGARLLSWREVR